VATRQPDGPAPYHSTVIVCLTELTKLCVSLPLAARSGDAFALPGDPLPAPGVPARLPRPAGGHPWLSPAPLLATLSYAARGALPMAVPAAVYAVQNVLVVAAAGLLPVASLVAGTQLKIISGGAFQVLLLGKALTRRQWICLAGLTLSVALAAGAVGGLLGHHDHPDMPTPTAAPASPGLTPAPEGMGGSDRMALGLLCVVSAATCSGFAGAYTEMKMKNLRMGGTPSHAANYSVSTGTASSMAPVPGAGSASRAPGLWTRNLQLAMASGCGSLVLACIFDGASILRHGPFRGFAWPGWPLAVIAIQSVGGLLVGAVLRRAHQANIVKDMAASGSMLLTIPLGRIFFGEPLTVLRMLGAAGIGLCVSLFAASPPHPSIVKRATEHRAMVKDYVGDEDDLGAPPAGPREASGGREGRGGAEMSMLLGPDAEPSSSVPHVDAHARDGTSDPLAPPRLPGVPNDAPAPGSPLHVRSRGPSEDRGWGQAPLTPQRDP